MTRILTIIALLFATPAWALNSMEILWNGEVLAGGGLGDNRWQGGWVLVKYKGYYYNCISTNSRFDCKKIIYSDTVK